MLFTSAAKREIKMPTRTNTRGKRALFSMRFAMSIIGIKIEINRI
jgi:hypothetical protein